MLLSYHTTTQWLEIHSAYGDYELAGGQLINSPGLSYERLKGDTNFCSCHFGKLAARQCCYESALQMLAKNRQCVRPAKFGSLCFKLLPFNILLGNFVHLSAK